MVFQFYFEEQCVQNGTLPETVLFDICFLCLQKLADRTIIKKERERRLKLNIDFRLFP